MELQVKLTSKLQNKLMEVLQKFALVKQINDERPNPKKRTEIGSANWNKKQAYMISLS